MSEQESALDKIARRIRNYIAAGVLLVGACGSAATFAVQRITSTTRAQIKDTHDDLTNLARLQNERAVIDSVRFERAMEVLEFAVAAIVEPDGSLEQRNALAELRRRRHFSP